jgi:hypothetical protein
MRQAPLSHRLLRLAVAVCLLGAASLALASGGAASRAPAAPEMPAFELFGPGDLWTRLGREPSLDVGRWLEYRISSPEQNDSTVRISVVPQGDLPTSLHRVVEVRILEPTGDRNYVKMLLTGIVGGTRRLAAMQVKQASLPLLDLPVGGGADDTDRIVEPTLEGASEMRVEEVGIVPVETPLGTFRCRHVQVFEGDAETPGLEVWIDVEDRVPLWGIVKSSQAGRVSLLTAHGEGARSDLPPIRSYH